MAENVGTLAKMLAAEASISSGSTPFAFLSETLKASRELIEDPGVRGTRSRSKERVTRGLTRVAGQTVHQPSPTELDQFLPWILGADESTDSFALADALQEVNIAILRGASLAADGMFTYDGCKVGQAVFSGSEGQAIKLAIDWVGKGCTTAAGSSFPSVALDTDGVYIFQGGVLTIQGATRRFSEFQLTINNFVESAFNNSATATDVDALDRDIMLSVNMPYIASHGEPVFTAEEADTLAAGAAGSLVFTSNRGANQSLTFTFANLKPAPFDDPNVGGKTRIRLPITYKALMSSTTRELVVTHDSSP